MLPSLIMISWLNSHKNPRLPCASNAVDAGHFSQYFQPKIQTEMRKNMQLCCQLAETILINWLETSKQS